MKPRHNFGNGNVCGHYFILLFPNSILPFQTLCTSLDAFLLKYVICEENYDSNNFVDPLAKLFTFLKTKYISMLNFFYSKSTAQYGKEFGSNKYSIYHCFRALAY